MLIMCVMGRREAKEKLSKGAASGMVALVFLILGFQLAVFVIKVLERPPREGESVGYAEGEQQEAPAGTETVPPAFPLSSGASRPSSGKRRVPAGRPASGRKVESFRFDPNTVTVDDMVRLGLSPRQAESIANYRGKGGRFRSKDDFRKMYVVSDTLFSRLEPYIEIPKIELNTADSAALVSLRGIGPWYARKIMDYRSELGGFVSKEQLMEIDGIDRERFDGFSDAVTVDPSLVHRLDLWHSPDSLLAKHPYLGSRLARSVVRYRELFDSTRWTLPDLASEGAISEEAAKKIKKYIEIQ